VKNWLRSVTFHFSSASKIRNGLLKAIPLITNWLSWMPGTGHLMAIGRDKILGLGTDSYLSNSLINALSQKHVSVLAHVWRPHEQDSLLSTWYNSLELELTGNLVEEWDRFRRALHALGVSLFDNEDELIWTRGDSSGDLSTKNLYAALISTLNF